jgi:cytoskeletal protein RodZ
MTREPRHRFRLVAGRPRKSTLVLIGLFLGFFTLYIWVRPVTASNTGNVQQDNPAPTQTPTTPAYTPTPRHRTLSPTPSRSPTPSVTGTPSHTSTPTPTTSTGTGTATPTPTTTSFSTSVTSPAALPSGSPLQLPPIPRLISGYGTERSVTSWERSRAVRVLSDGGKGTEADLR